jgi:hypothetical protein
MTTMASADPPIGVLAPSDPAVLGQAAFERFPYSLIVVDRGGRVVAVNLEAERLIGDYAASRLFVCRRA